MPKRAVALVEEPEPNTTSDTREDNLAARKRVVARLRARMAKPPSATEIRLWRELKAEMEKDRLTFRS